MRQKFKQFTKEFREHEKLGSPSSGYKDARNFATQCLSGAGPMSLPKSAHWRIYMVLADLSKRENQLEHAEQLFEVVHKLKPKAHIAWLEHAKMEEEYGRLDTCGRVLGRGLELCKQNQPLLNKAIRHEERSNNMQNARHLMSGLRSSSVENSWKTMLEGALMEGRDGKIDTARVIFQYLIENVSWYPPIYLEASRFEEKIGNVQRGLEIVIKGLESNERYGPLWFLRFRLLEKDETVHATLHHWALFTSYLQEAAVATTTAPLAPAPFRLQLGRTLEDLEKSTDYVSKELIWKVYFESAQVMDRAASTVRRVFRQETWMRLLFSNKYNTTNTSKTLVLDSKEFKKLDDATTKDALKWAGLARTAYTMSALHCPEMLRWKVWVAGARTEMACGKVYVAGQLLERAMKCVSYWLWLLYRYHVDKMLIRC